MRSRLQRKTFRARRNGLCVEVAIFVLFMGLPCLSSLAFGEDILIDDFSRGLHPSWKEKVFSGKTSYTAVTEDGRPAVKARSNASASGLYREVDIDLADRPFLSWSWKIDGVLVKGDGRKKEGDDYAARIYAVFPSWLFWRTKTITYVWANTLPVDEPIESPFTANAIMIPVQSGNERAGQWIEEKRNVWEDYRRAFKTDPPKCKAVAIMTDTDNTGETATAWYGPIRIQVR